MNHSQCCGGARSQLCTDTTVDVHAGDDVHDTDLQQHALAALQKLSLRRSAQEALVQVNMVHTCTEFLCRHETLSEHTVEYSLATLMNMCLCRAGRCDSNCLLCNKHNSLRVQHRFTNTSMMYSCAGKPAKDLRYSMCWMA